MARAVPGFSADDFRSGIRLAMQVGLPPDLEDQPLFVFPRTATNTGPADEDGVPFNPDEKPVLSPLRSVRVQCAVEYDDASSRVENLGLISPSVIKITLLDEEYAQVKGFSYVVIGGDRYNYRLTETPLGLDVVGVWTIHCTAEDDT